MLVLFICLLCLTPLTEGGKKNKERNKKPAEDDSELVLRVDDLEKSVDNIESMLKNFMNTQSNKNNEVGALF